MYGKEPRYNEVPRDKRGFVYISEFDCDEQWLTVVNGVVVNALDFRSEGRRFDAQSLPSSETETKGISDAQATQLCRSSVGTTVNQSVI